MPGLTFQIFWPDSYEFYKNYFIETDFRQYQEMGLTLNIFFERSFSPHSVSTANEPGFRLKARKKGRYKPAGIYVSRRSMLGLLTLNYQIENNKEIVVLNPVLHLSRIFKNQRVNRHQKIVDSPGGEMEFYALRGYQVGDTLRQINWKKSAREDEIFVNTYQKEENRRVLICMNTGMSSRYPYGNYTFLDYQISMAYLLAMTIHKRNDQVGLMWFRSQMYRYLPPSLDRKQMQKIYTALKKTESGPGFPQFEQLYRQLRSELPAGSIVIMLSPFLSPMDILLERKSLDLIRKRYQVIWVNPLRNNEMNIDDLAYLWQRVHEALEQKKLKQIFSTRTMTLIHEKPAKLYEKTIREYLRLTGV